MCQIRVGLIIVPRHLSRMAAATRYTRNPTRNTKYEIRNPKHETRKHETRNPKLKTRNTEHEIRNPEPGTRNPNQAALQPWGGGKWIGQHTQVSHAHNSEPGSRTPDPEARSTKHETRNANPKWVWTTCPTVPNYIPKLLVQRPG